MNGTRAYFLRAAFFAPFGEGFGRLAAGLGVDFAFWALLGAFAAGRGAGLTGFGAFDGFAGFAAWATTFTAFAGAALTGFAGVLGATTAWGRAGGTGLAEAGAFLATGTACAAAGFPVGIFV